MKPPTVFLGEMTNVEVESFLKEHDTVIVPTGATEQHGPHAPLLTDVLIPQEIARRDFRLFDFDESGALSAAEFSTLPMVVAPRDRGALPNEPIHARVEAQIEQVEAAWDSLDKSRNGKVTVGQFVSGSKELFTTPLQWLFASLGDLVVRQLADHAQLKRLAFVLGEAVEGRREHEARREPLVDPRQSLLGGEVDREPESPARVCLDAIAANRFPQDVPRDPEQPGQGRAAVVVTKAVLHQPRLRERLRC